MNNLDKLESLGIELPKTKDWDKCWHDTHSRRAIQELLAVIERLVGQGKLATEEHQAAIDAELRAEQAEAEVKAAQALTEDFRRQMQKARKERRQAEAENRELQLDLKDVLRKRELCEERLAQVRAALAAMTEQRDWLAEPENISLYRYVFDYFNENVPDEVAEVLARYQPGGES